MKATIVRRRIPASVSEFPIPVGCSHCGDDLEIHEYVDLNAKTLSIECCDRCDEPHQRFHNLAMFAKEHARLNVAAARRQREHGFNDWRVKSAQLLSYARDWRIAYTYRRNEAIKAG